MKYITVKLFNYVNLFDNIKIYSATSCVYFLDIVTL